MIASTVLVTGLGSVYSMIHVPLSSLFHLPATSTLAKLANRASSLSSDALYCGFAVVVLPMNITSNRILSTAFL